MTAGANISQLLLRWNEGDQAALDQLMPLVYADLRRLARSYLRRERPDHTLQATALVNEAYLRLIDQHSVTWRNRAHFFAIAAQMMRRILVNYALAKQAAKRGGLMQKLALEELEAEGLAPADRRGIEVVALDGALKELERLDPRQARSSSFGTSAVSRSTRPPKSSKFPPPPSSASGPRPDFGCGVKWTRGSAGVADLRRRGL